MDKNSNSQNSDWLDAALSDSYSPDDWLSADRHMQGTDTDAQQQTASSFATAQDSVNSPVTVPANVGKKRISGFSLALAIVYCAVLLIAILAIYFNMFDNYYFIILNVTFGFGFCLVSLSAFANFLGTWKILTITNKREMLTITTLLISIILIFLFLSIIGALLARQVELLNQSLLTIIFSCLSGVFLGASAAIVIYPYLSETLIKNSLLGRSNIISKVPRWAVAILVVAAIVLAIASVCITPNAITSDTEMDTADISNWSDNGNPSILAIDDAGNIATTDLRYFLENRGAFNSDGYLSIDSNSDFRRNTIYFRIKNGDLYKIESIRRNENATYTILTSDHGEYLLNAQTDEQ
jgi:hypothetical protein